MNKYGEIINRTWEYLENNYKGSEITMELFLNRINRECDTEFCLRNCIKMLWAQWEWYFDEEREYYKKYIKNNYGVRVN